MNIFKKITALAVACVLWLHATPAYSTKPYVYNRNPISKHLMWVHSDPGDTYIKYISPSSSTMQNQHSPQIPALGYFQLDHKHYFFYVDSSTYFTKAPTFTTYYDIKPFKPEITTILQRALLSENTVLATLKHLAKMAETKKPPYPNPDDLVELKNLQVAWLAEDLEKELDSFPCVPPESDPLNLLKYSFKTLLDQRKD